MTYLLAGVTNLREAEIALDGGADIIDLRDASQDMLGALPIPAITETVALIARRRPVSAAAGRLAMDPASLVQRVAALSETGVDYVRVGLFADPRQQECIAALTQAAQHVALIGVLFADQKPDIGLLQPMVRAGFAGVMLDVADRSQGGLRRHVGDAGLGRFVGRAVMHGLLSGLGGSLTLEDLPPLLALGPDFLAFRGALCARGDRLAELDPESVVTVRQHIPRHGETDLRAPVARQIGAMSGGHPH